MKIIKLNAIASTNSYLKQESAENYLEDFTVVVAKTQSEGRGQMGAIWTAESGKNLTFSVFKRNESVATGHQFYISIVTTLGILKTLQSLQIGQLNVKWPNDILSEHKKICGVLIENVIKNNSLVGSIIGIGLNVNQTKFTNLPHASSLHNISGRIFNLDELLISIVNNMKFYFKQLNERPIYTLKRAYESVLFRRNKPSTFRDSKGKLFSGFIKGVDDFGNLIVCYENKVTKTYGLKEIELLY